MTDPGSKAGFDLLPGALALAFLVLVLGSTAAIFVDSVTDAPRGCDAACSCREASP